MSTASDSRPFPARPSGDAFRRRWALDALVAGATAILVLMLIHLDPEHSPRAPDFLAYTLGVVSAAALLGRRSSPAGTFAGVFVVHSVYHMLGYPGAGPFPATLVTLFTLAAEGLRRLAGPAAALVILSSVAVQVVGEGAGLFDATVILPGVLAMAAVLAGEAAHNRTRYLDEVSQRLRRVELDQQMETERRVTEERLRIARELHDIMAHTIAVISVQAAEAQDALEEHPEQAGAALKTIRTASREAMLELGAAVGVMRDHAETESVSHGPAPGLRELAELVDSASSTDLRVLLRTEGPSRRAPAAVELTVYRLVQEALTNVIRHARASVATVTLIYEPSAIVVRIEDDGLGPAEDGGEGFGVMGMFERVEAIGGRLEAGAGPDGGYRVHAVVPADEPA